MPETVRPAFDGHSRPQLSYGIDFPTAAARYATNTKASRVYVICSGSLARNTDSLTRLTAALGPERVAGQRIGMKTHTQWSEVLEIVADARKAKADMLLTLGAGSLTDGAKIVAFALANDASTVEDLETLAEGSKKRADVVASTIPIVSVPTSLSAGEYSDFAGGTEDQSHRKYMFYPPLRGPELVILDPELVETTPDSIWLSTGVRAVDHCVETLCAVGITTPGSDELARNALSRLVPGLLRCKKNRADRDASLQCQLGSVDAMAACTIISFKLGASHGIGHQLGPLGVGHGETSCICLPAVCKFNAAHNANTDRQASLRDFLIQDPVVAGVLRERLDDVSAADLGDVLDAVIRELGMPRSLADVGIGRDKLEMLAENTLHDPLCQSNPIPLTKKSQVLEILEMVVE